jgi:two-component system CheB/CheR fusion protein
VYDPQAATQLYRIAQEAVRDAVHQGRSKRISIELNCGDNSVVLCILDNGLRLSEDGRYRDEMVQRMMQHRAKLIGATLSIAARPSGGVKVTCEAPQPKDNHKRV